MFRINGLRYPIEKRFGRGCCTLLESSSNRGDGKFKKKVKKLEKNEFPFKILMREFTKWNQRKIFGKKNEEILRFLLDAEDKKITNIEMMISTGMKFSNSTVFSKIAKLEEFLDYNGILNLYIAQFPIYKKMKFSDFHNKSSKQTNQKLKEILGNKNKEAIKKLLGKFVLPEIFMEKLDRLERVNLWCGRKRTVSKLHFDLYSNYLLVLKGKKTVFLFPPDSKMVKNSKINFQTFHEGKLVKRKKLKKNKILKIYPKIKKKEELWRSGLIKAELCEGEALFIPEGWYHYVISEKDTIAVNFWFESIMVKIEKKEDNLRNFLILKKLKKNLKKIAEKSIVKSGYSLKMYEPKRVKRSIIELLMDKILVFKNFVKCDIEVKKKLFLNYLLEQLEVSDDKINAKKFILENEFEFGEGKKLGFDHTDSTKEFFYDFFGIYFGEEERIAALGVQKELVDLMLRSDVKSLIEGFN